VRLDGLTRILAAANGSEAGTHAACFGERLAGRLGAKYQILEVATHGVPGYPDEPHRGAPSRERLISRGIPGIEIARAAADWQADVVVIGRRPRVDPAEELGPTIEAVIRRLNKPCLLIPPGVDELHRMLVALDGTLRGLGILPCASTFAEGLSLKASSVYVAADALSAGFAAGNAAGDLVNALIGFPAVGGETQLTTRFGPPVRTILDEAAVVQADLLVVGVRRGGPPGDAGSGHVGRDLLRRAPTAILTVPI